MSTAARRASAVSFFLLLLVSPWSTGIRDGSAFIAAPSSFNPRAHVPLGRGRPGACPATLRGRRAPGLFSSQLLRLAAQTETRAPALETVRGSTTGPRPLDGGSGAREGVNLYFAEFNFCLNPRDSALSGPTITKTLNRMTNEVIKNILILNSPEDAAPAGRQLQALRRRFAEENEAAGDAGVSIESAAGLAYLDSVVSLGLPTGCPSHDALGALEDRYREAFRRVVRVLEDFGCTVTEGVPGRVTPKDKDVCLSVLDYAAGTVETRTRALNSVANRVCRTMCVGNDEDLASLAREMESRRALFLQRWLGDNWQGSQEDKFYGGLVALLTHGFADPPAGLGGPYSNAFQRLVDILVQEVGTGAAPASGKVLDSFVRWERDLRKNITEPAWDANPADLLGSWALGDDYSQAGLGLELDIPNRLSDASSARGAAAAVGGSGGAGSNDGANWRITPAKELLVTFRADGGVTVSPEAGVGLRWRLEPGPTHLDTIYFEMLSTADSDTAAVATAATPSSQAASGRRDGGAAAAAAAAELPVAAAGDSSGVLLSYTGYVDRGARIEARFSKRPIKMTGRLTRVVRGVARPSTRFSMRLVQRTS